ncbi:MAG TPA: peptidylprolyl isomerase [Gemmatimonadales bacterium]|nr:peptidylprolyl isomerase [Gemmatimonadales bacterium]
MMQAFRNSAKVAGAIFALLMLIFVLTSVDWQGLGTTSAVGKVNGETVDVRTFQTAVQRTIESRQQQSPAPLGLEDRARIEDEVWQQFVESGVLESEYKRRGITVSDDEIVQALRNSPPSDFMNVPEFQTDSQFDLGKYQRWLTSSVATQYLPALEAQYRDQLRRSKLLRVVTADVYLSDHALWQQYRDEHEQVKVALTAIIPRNAVPDSSVKLSEEEITAYYRAHQDEFKRQSTAFLSFVALPRLTNASDTAFARARADSARAEILAGAPFADIARRESADSASAANGGDLGEWERGAMDPAFDSAAFSLPLNRVSEPVLSQFGFHLIEVTSRKGKKAKARHVLFPIELDGPHREQVDARADSLERLASERTDPAALDTVARALGLPIGRSGPVQKGTKVQLGNLAVPDAGIWAFQNKPGATSPVIETSVAFYVFRLDSLQKEGVPPLAQIHDAVAATARQAKKRDLARKLGEEYVKRVEGGTSMAAAAEAMKLPHREFGPFSRVNPPLTDPIVVGTAFGLDQGQRSGLLDTKDGLYVLQTVERVKADSTQFVKELDAYRGRMIQLARQDRVRGFLAALRESAKVVDNRAKLQEQQQQQAAPAAPPVI